MRAHIAREGYPFWRKKHLSDPLRGPAPLGRRYKMSFYIFLTSQNLHKALIFVSLPQSLFLTLDQTCWWYQQF